PPVDLDRMLSHRRRQTAAREQPPHLDLERRLEGGIVSTIQDLAQCRDTGTALCTELTDAPQQEPLAHKSSSQRAFNRCFQRLRVERPAKSMSVRAELVIGMPSRRVRSMRGSSSVRCTVSLLVRSLRLFGTQISIPFAVTPSRPQRTPAARCDTTDPDPA